MKGFFFIEKLRKTKLSKTIIPLIRGIKKKKGRKNRIIL